MSLYCQLVTPNVRLGRNSSITQLSEFWILEIFFALRSRSKKHCWNCCFSWEKNILCKFVWKWKSHFFNSTLIAQGKYISIICGSNNLVATEMFNKYVLFCHGRRDICEGSKEFPHRRQAEFNSGPAAFLTHPREKNFRSYQTKA